MSEPHKQSNSTSNSQSKRQRLVKNIILHIKIQKMIKAWRKSVKKSRQRINILKQWAKTQEDYIKDLNIIVNKIEKPMLQSKLITAEEDRILFPNLNAMLKLSGELLVAVNGFLQNWNPHHTLIGDVLINFHKYFIIYREYCNNFYKAQKIMKELKKRPECEKIISSLVMDIQSYIIKPVQRPPKYQLLLREYQKALNPNHKDYASLTKAIQKYHDVNEQNNQSMDLQIRNEKMIQLDKKYGGIINTTRVYLFQEVGKSIDFKVKIYVFNDLILVVKVHSDEKQQGYKKIFLDGLSFVDAPMDGKYLINKLFICGTKENLHINFMSSNTRNRVYDQLQKIIHELYRKQTNKTVLKKKGRSKMMVMNIQQIQIKTKPKLRITVVGAQKRPNLLLNLHYDTIYILKIQAPFPSNIFQYSNLKFDDLVGIQKEIKSKNKMLSMPLLDDKPQDMSMYDVKKNKTKIIECREVYIERFINFIFRSEELQQYSDMIVKVLKINEDLWKFASYNQPCNCEICLQQKQNLSLQQFEQQKQQIRNAVSSSISIPSRYSTDSFSRSSLGFRLDGSVCLFNSFMMPKKILEASIGQLNTLERRLTWLQCKQGRIDYTLIPKNEAQNNIKVTINLLSLKQDENINVRINRESTVLQAIDQIASMYKIETMRDFGLVLQYQDVPRILDRDEKLWETLKQIQYQLQQPQQTKKQGTSIWNKLNNIKKWGEEMISGKKSKLYLKKCIFVANQLEIKACQQNPQRYSLIVQEVFYRFKNQLMILGSNDTKKLCALYYILNYMDKLPYLNEANFQIEKLKNLLPEAKWHLLNDSVDFQRSVFIYIKQCEEKMENHQLSNNRRSNSVSTIFSKVQVIYELILNVAYKVMSWGTMFFQVINYDPPTLPGACTNLLLGVNRKSLIIIRHKQIQPLLQIQLKKLDYKITVMSIFIQTEQKVLRFDGQMMFDVEKLIQTYKIMAQKFGDS